MSMAAVLERAEKDLSAMGAQYFRSGDYQEVGIAQELATWLSNKRIQLSGIANLRSDDPASNGKTLGQRTYRVSGSTLYQKGIANRTGKPYEHGVPRDAYDKVLQNLSKMSAEFQMSDLIGNLPAYQPYVVVKFLERRRHIERVRRGFYRVHDPGKIADIGRGLWNEVLAKGEVTA